MTDNELTAKVGRLLMCVVVKEGTRIDGGPFWWMPRPWHAIAKSVWYELPTDEQVGESIRSDGRGYATDPRWVGPIILAAKERGISLIVGPRGGTSDEYECEFGPLKGTSSSSRFGTLPRCVCLAVVAALEEA